MPTNKDFLDLCKTSLSGDKEDVLRYIRNYALKANASKKYSLYNNLLSIINENSETCYSSSSSKQKTPIPVEERIRVADSHKDQVNTFIEYVKKSHHTHSQFNRILLYGPPGTGKTTLGRHIAHSIGLDVNYVKISDIIGSKLGETLQNIDKVFQDPDKKIIFLDEFDVYAKNRQDSNDIGELKRTVNSFIQTLDNPEYNKVVIVSTNIVSEIDPAIMRRFKFKVLIDHLNNDEVISFLIHQTALDKSLCLDKREVNALVKSSTFKSLDDVVTCIDLARIYKAIHGGDEKIYFSDIFETANKEGFISKDSLKKLKREQPKMSKELHGFIKSYYGVSRFAEILNVHRNTFKTLFAV